MANTNYDETFFAFHEVGSRTSARETIPLVLELLRPASVVDVGCGLGTWLTEFKAAGVADYLGIDGDYVDRSKLLIEPSRFLARDLAQPLDVGRRFELAVSLEVAEHLPSQSAATFVESLSRLAPVVLFSAAIPHQGGTGHLNEQWPEYWQKLFLKHDYVVVDGLRQAIWNNAAVKPWYRQNMLFFVERQRLPEYPRLEAIFAQAGATTPLSLVHRETYLAVHKGLSREIRDLRCMVMRFALRLRDVNLLVFPDWSQSKELVTAQIRALLGPLAAHPARSRITLVIQVGTQSRETVQHVLREASRDLSAPGAISIAGGPEISAVDRSFDVLEWEVLLECVRYRITLPQEDARAIAASGAGSLQTVSLAALQAGQLIINT